jgi:MFS family permease
MLGSTADNKRVVIGGAFATILLAALTSLPEWSLSLDEITLTPQTVAFAVLQSLVPGALFIVGWFVVTALAPEAKPKRRRA